VTQQDYKQGFALQNNNYFQLSAGTGITTTNGTTTGDRLLSYFGKLNYSWSDRWLASVTLRMTAVRGSAPTTGMVFSLLPASGGGSTTRTS